mmetsp:Transcript_66219/g.56285  ORF Transcript_66219/g.56285 Transcript_66219/m.56285 type:complete len:83 (+) Transcript_66219:167-415(+)
MPIKNSCLMSAAFAYFGGYIAGLGFGFLMQALGTNSVTDSAAPMKYQFRELRRNYWRHMLSTARNFSLFGAVIVGLECPLEK